jgi:hypothetical protein
MYTQDLTQEKIEALDPESYSNFLAFGDPLMPEMPEKRVWGVDCHAPHVQPMKNLVPGTYTKEELLMAIDELEEDLMNIPAFYPNPTRYKSPFYEEEDDN